MLAAGGGGVCAETLLVFATNSVVMNAEEPDLRVVKLQSAVEEGIMSVLFDDGHIVFNAGIVTSNEPLSIVSDRLSVRLAKNGGASWLLEVDLDYDTRDQEVVLVQAVYRLYHLDSLNEITAGEVFTRDVRTREDQDDQVLGELMGKGIGFHVIRFLADSSVVKFP